MHPFGGVSGVALTAEDDTLFIVDAVAESNICRIASTTSREEEVDCSECALE